MTTKLYSDLEKTINSLNILQISPHRRKVLQPLIHFIREQNNPQSINLNFICTHNSRRSILSQVWAQTMATYFGVHEVFCYSGGTEITAVYPIVLHTLKNNGFGIKKLSNNPNPIYSIKLGNNSPSIIAFSKKFDTVFNPNSNFVAIMTCTTADENCPFIAGAIKRIPIAYEDPKCFDNTPKQKQKYDECSLQIAVEMKYIFLNIQQK